MSDQYVKLEEERRQKDRADKKKKDKKKRREKKGGRRRQDSGPESEEDITPAQQVDIVTEEMPEVRAPTPSTGPGGFARPRPHVEAWGCIVRELRCVCVWMKKIGRAHV